MASAPNPGRPRAGRISDRRRAFFAAMLLAAVGLSGCQGITSTSAQLRVIDASPDAGVIDSYQNSSALAYNLGFGTMTTYIPMSPGVYNLAANKAGTRQTLVANSETLAPNRQYTEIIGAGLANLQQTLCARSIHPRSLRPHRPPHRQPEHPLRRRGRLSRPILLFASQGEQPRPWPSTSALAPTPGTSISPKAPTPSRSFPREPRSPRRP